MTQKWARLELPTVDYGGAIGEKTGVAFEFGTGAEGKVSIGEEIRTGFIFNNQFDQVLGFVESQLGVDVPGELREGVHIDVGGGEHTWDIQWQSPGDTRRQDGGDFQWGSSSNPADGPNAHTATGADTLAQQAVFMNALRSTTIDSRTPAVFSYGEWSSSGFLAPQNVVIENPTTTSTNTQPNAFDGAFNLVSTASLNDPIDAEDNDER